MAKERNNRFLVWGIVIIVILAVAYFMFSSNSPLLAPKTSARADDACPNPTTSKTVCIGEIECYCLSSGGFIKYWSVPSGSSCRDSAPSDCNRTTISSGLMITSLNEACNIALSSLSSPGGCSTGCTDKGVIPHSEETTSCCTKKLERDCRLETTKVVVQ